MMTGSPCPGLPCRGSPYIHVGLDLDHAQWVITAYTIAGALVVPAVGWLGQRLGNRRLYFLSLFVFLTTSTLCAFAWSGPALITLRILQGLGGAAERCHRSTG